MEEVKEEKILSKKEIRRRKRLSERLKKGRERYYKKLRKQKEKKLAKEKEKKEKEKEKKRLKREQEKALKKQKKKVGRPKKSGPKINYYKRKKKLLAKQNREKKTNRKPEFKYKIISCLNGIQKRFIGKYRTSEEAYEVFNKLKMEDKNIVFPTLLRGDEYLDNSIDEYLLIEKSDKENSMLRNEYGKLVEQKTNIDGWIVLDKFRYQIEETFWVYGYDNRSDRKTFSWIYENIITVGCDYKYDYKRILVYKNKIVVKHDDGNLDLIFCKDISDAIRFYNQLELWVKRDKIKQILFIGDYSSISPKRKQLENEIMELTGWPRAKVQMKGTTKYRINKPKDVRF